eukprot:jgi/Hompol1/297/HPOL_000894-RA
MTHHNNRHAIGLKVITSTQFQRMPWKNGLGETAEIAIYPAQRNFRADPFLWRLSLSEVRDSCSFSLFPGYDVTLFLLPESGANVQLRGNLSAPAFLHHHDQTSAVPVKPLVPYTYRGEWPTTCRMNLSPLKHLTFIANRRVTRMTMSLETICQNVQGDDGCCDGDGDGDGGDATDNFILSDPLVQDQLSSLPSPQQLTANPSTSFTSNSSSNFETGSNSNLEKRASTTNKLLLSNFTIVYVVKGTIKVSVEGDDQIRTVRQGETLICERDEESILYWHA